MELVLQIRPYLPTIGLTSAVVLLAFLLWYLFLVMRIPKLERDYSIRTKELHRETNLILGKASLAPPPQQLEQLTSKELVGLLSQISAELQRRADRPR
jgi:hypothetical protein